MLEYQRAAVPLVAVASLIALLLGGCSQPARPERMSTEAVSAPVSSEPPEIATLFVTVYGEDVGGFASHYYPLPREDFEAALRNSIATSSRFAATSTRESADYEVNVGLISLVAPKWSGTVTLETTWAITAPNGGEEIARKMIRSETPSPFGKIRDATEEVAKMCIDSGLEWMDSTLAPMKTGD